MSTAVALSLLWLGFIGTHIALADDKVEPGLRARLTDQGFLGVYSLVAFAFFVPLVWIYWTNRHAGEWLWVVSLGPVARGLLYATMTFALGLLVAGSVRPTPASVAPGEASVEGATRITRHPVVMGIGLLMGLHVIPNGNTADLAFFGGFVALGLVGAWHQDKRKLAYGDPAFLEFHAATAFLPFAGKGSLRGLAEIPVWVWAVSLLAMLGMRWLHPGGIWP